MVSTLFYHFSFIFLSFFIHRRLAGQFRTSLTSLTDLLLFSFFYITASRPHSFPSCLSPGLSSFTVSRCYPERRVRALLQQWLCSLAPSRPRYLRQHHARVLCTTGRIQRRYGASRRIRLRERLQRSEKRPREPTVVSRRCRLGSADAQ